MEEMCGINLITYYMSNVFLQIGTSYFLSLLLSGVNSTTYFIASLCPSGSLIDMVGSLSDLWCSGYDMYQGDAHSLSALAQAILLRECSPYYPSFSSISSIRSVAGWLHHSCILRKSLPYVSDPKVLRSLSCPNERSTFW
jgi:hypothetical protein